MRRQVWGESGEAKARKRGAGIPQMITREVIKCKCHKELVRTEKIKGRPFNKKKYFCMVTNRQLKSEDFIYEKMKVNLRDPKDDTWDGNEVECPEDLEKAYDDYKKRAAGNGDD